jgi:type II restriction enzyme
MTERQPYLQHLTGSDDLVTTSEAIRFDLIALAFERNRQATPFVEQARALKVAASQVAAPTELIKTKEIQPALLVAAGMPDKLVAYLRPQDKLEAMQQLIRNYLEPAGAAFVEELVFRFLLMRGDTLGGSMRNVGGVLAQRKLTRAIISHLALAGIPYQWLHATTNAWAQVTDEDADIELSLRGLSWLKGRKSRTVIYNLTVPLLKNNVDLCLFNCAPQELSPTIYKSPASYIALGELKGGIDPAGADEHWKTARTALARIQKTFSARGRSPHTFFVGAAVEKKMANEIWSMLRDSSLSNAANLTDTNQLASVAAWLCEL